jgi:hypothetical protein
MDKDILKHAKIVKKWAYNGHDYYAREYPDGFTYIYRVDNRDGYSDCQIGNMAYDYCFNLEDSIERLAIRLGVI